MHSSAFKKGMHHHSSWRRSAVSGICTRRFLPGVLLGFAIKWWMDNGTKVWCAHAVPGALSYHMHLKSSSSAAAVGELQGDSSSQRVNKKTDRVLASKPAVKTNEEYKMVRRRDAHWMCSQDGNAKEAVNRPWP